MSPYDELQYRVLELPLADRSRMAVAVLDSLDDEELDDLDFEALTDEILSRSARYARGELRSQDWRAGLDAIQLELDQSAPS